MLNARIWRHGPFLRFFVGASLSNVGNWFNTVAVAVLIYKLTGQVSSVAVAIAVSVVPRVLLAPIGGALADRFERHNLLLALDVVRAFIALLPLATHDAGTVWLVYFALLLLQAGSCIYNPAQGAYLPQVVPDSLLEPANAAYASVRDIGMFVGPALAWAVLRAWGPSVAFYGNALSFAISAALLLTLPQGSHGLERVVHVRSLLAGYAGIVRRYPHIAALYLCILGTPIPIFFFQAIMVAYAGNLGLPAAFVGIFYAAAGVGGALGAFVMGHYLPRLPYAIVVAIYALCVPLLGALALVHSVQLTLLLLAASTAAGTAGDVLFSVNVQRYVAPEERGRAFGLQFWCVPIGQLVGAAIGAGVNLHTAAPTLLWIAAGVAPLILLGAILSIRAGQPPGVGIHRAITEGVQ